MIEKIILGFFVPIILIYTGLWIKSARLKVVIKPHRRWLIDNLYSPNLIVEITNLGYDNCIIDDVKLEFKKGSYSEFIVDELLHPRLNKVVSKETETIIINCDQIVRNGFISKTDSKVYRCIVLTTSGKVYRSSWGELGELKKTWDIKI